MAIYYKCDRCHAESKEADFLKTISVTYERRMYNGEATERAELCNGCRTLVADFIKPIPQLANGK